MLRQNVVGKKKKNVFACVKLVVTRWRAFRLSNQCSLTRVTGSYTCWKSFFFLFNITRCIKKKNWNFHLFSFKGGISEMMAFSTEVNKFGYFTANG